MRLKIRKTGEIISDEEAKSRFAGYDSLAEFNEVYEDAPEEKKYGGRVPKEMDRYFVICSEGEITAARWNNHFIDKNRFAAGSAFWTREEAEKELARRKAYVILKEDTKGFKPDWEDSDKRKYYVEYDWRCAELTTNLAWALQDGTGLYFATREDARDSIKAHRQQWLDYLCVKEEE